LLTLTNAAQINAAPFPSSGPRTRLYCLPATRSSSTLSIDQFELPFTGIPAFVTKRGGARHETPSGLTLPSYGWMSLINVWNIGAGSVEKYSSKQARFCRGSTSLTTLIEPQ